MESPPVFQEAPRCDVCNCSFNTFRRRHHCRSCGRTLCHDHSLNQMALPQFGVYSNVRVCDDCFSKSTRCGQNDRQTSSDTANSVTDKISRLNMGEDVASNAQGHPGEPVLSNPDCNCGMPLCICEAPTPDPVPSKPQNISVSVQTNPRPKKAVSSQQSAESFPKNQASSSSNKPSPFFNLGQASNESSNEGPAAYDVSGEGLREAIKSSDINAVKKLLSEGVDANYCDKQGLTLLHLAALFNRTEIVFILMDHGANAERKNAQGETPLDCAPTMLQNKMHKKMEDMQFV